MAAQNLRGFTEKVALVTDGANEIGRAVALQLALQGCYVIVGYSNINDNNRNALNELQAIGTLASAVEADASNLAGVKILFEKVEQSYGRLDLLVNTLKFAPESSFLETSEVDFAETMDANLKSVFFCSQFAAKLMQKRPSPSIVNVAYDDVAVNPALVAANAAIIGLTKSLANKLAPKIRVNCVSVRKFTENAEDMFAFLTESNGVSADDAARVVVYLLSSEAKAVTGQVISVGK